MFEATTQNIRVQVEPSYVADQSNPAQNQFYFAYKVTIQNQGSTPVQLLARHWVIEDAFGRTEEVTGPGVVGVQPKLEPGTQFEYSSFCPLPTPTGSMHGTYLMVNAKGEQIEVTIPKFILTEPSHYH